MKKALHGNIEYSQLPGYAHICYPDMAALKKCRQSNLSLEYQHHIMSSCTCT